MKQISNGLAVSALAFSLSLSLAACGGEPEAPVEVAEGDCPPGISVSEGWMVLPAVEGNPGAVYFTLANDSERQVTIRSASVLGAESAMMHETSSWNLQDDMQEIFTLAVMPGQSEKFEPGRKHVMAMGIGEGVAEGAETEVTLTFVGGDKCSFSVESFAAGQTPEWFEGTPPEQESEEG
ncbi:MAG: copper chaperone PCu(A)C [Alteraurantiacibacter sp.]